MPLHTQRYTIRYFILRVENKITFVNNACLQQIMHAVQSGQNLPQQIKIFQTWGTSQCAGPETAEVGWGCLLCHPYWCTHCLILCCWCLNSLDLHHFTICPCISILVMERFKATIKTQLWLLIKGPFLLQYIMHT